jgi:hypothetical protein
MIASSLDLDVVRSALRPIFDFSVSKSHALARSGRWIIKHAQIHERDLK